MKKSLLNIIGITIMETVLLGGCTTQNNTTTKEDEFAGYEQDYTETVKTETTAEPAYYETWGSSQYKAEDSNQPPLSLSGNSLRQIVHTSVGGDKIRVKFSNLEGERALIINEVHIAKTVSGSEIDTATDKTLTFDGNTGCTIEAGKELYSDLLDFSFNDLECLTVTIYFDSVPVAITGHMGSRTTSYLMEGSHLSDKTFSSTYTCEHWYILAGIDVYTTNVIRAVSCLGDSITDGRGSTTDQQNRWTDIFSQRLLANDATKAVSVVNQGIGGTCVTSSGTGRFNRDVIQTSGSYYAIVLYGINDIIYMNATKDTIINTYQAFIKKAHNNNIIIYGGTILPFGKCSDYSSDRDKVRLAVNQWIRNTRPEDGGFDGYIDFAKIMASASDSGKMNSAYDSGDGLHPGAAGYKAMGEVIPLSFFTRRLEDCKEEWPAGSGGSATVQNVSLFKYPLLENVAKDDTVEIEVKGTNNGTKGFRIWLTDDTGSNRSNIITYESTGAFTITDTLTATSPSGYLLFKGIDYQTSIENLTLDSVAVTINGAKTQINVTDDMIK